MSRGRYPPQTFQMAPRCLRGGDHPVPGPLSAFCWDGRLAWEEPFVLAGITHRGRDLLPPAVNLSRGFTRDTRNISIIGSAAKELPQSRNCDCCCNQFCVRWLAWRVIVLRTCCVHYLLHEMCVQENLLLLSVLGNGQQSYFYQNWHWEGIIPSQKTHASPFL